jgi:hypothetical protein
LSEANNPVVEAEAPAAQELAPEANAPGVDPQPTDINDWVNEGAPEPEPAADGESGDGETPETPPVVEAETVEIELDGKTFKVPAELKGAFLRQADYTRKTQELAASRQTMEAEAVAAAEARLAESQTALPQEHRRIAILDHQIETVKASLAQPLDASGATLGGIDWHAFRAAAQADPERMGPLYRDYRAAFDAANDSLADLQRDRSAAETDLKTKEDQRLTGQKEQAVKALQAAREETGKVLAREIEGWGPERAEAIAKFALNVGVQPAEIAEMTDPRVWKVLDRAMSAEAKVAKLEATLKQHQTVANTAKAQAVQPAAKVGGSGAPNARRTTDASGDQLSTDEWARRERERVAGKAKR